MNTVPVLEVCPNCGAPLELDPASECRWCHARIRTERAAPAFLRLQDEAGLVPDDANDCASAPFLSLALSSLRLLGDQPEVKEYMNGEPGLLRQIRALSTMVSAAGDWYAERHTWKKAMKKAGEGPVALREFRAAVPHRR